MLSSDDLYHLSMLSRLNLPEHVYIPAFLNQVHRHIPSLSNSYFWLDKKYKAIDVYDGLRQQQLSDAIKSFTDKYPYPSLQTFAHNRVILSDSPAWQDHIFRQLYKQCFIRCGYHQSCVIPVSAAKMPHGFLVLNRQVADSPFASKEIDKALQMKEELESGLNHCTNEEKTTTGWRSGLVIVDQRGEMAHCCPEGKNLLAMALQKKPGNLTRHAFADVRNIPGVIDIIAQVLENPSLNSTNEISINSYWGDFLIHAFPVHDQGQRAPQVYLNITWQVPFSLLLFHNIGSMCFTPRQEVIGLLYAAGESTKSIANKLGLSLYTIKEHIQHIFEKLQIHTRAELIEHIVCRDCGPSNEELQQAHLHGTERASMNIGRS